MTEVLDAPKAQTALAQIDLKALALSRFGDWRPEAEKVVAKFKGVLFDAATPKGYKALTEAIAEVRAPRYAAQNVSKASKSELAGVSKAVGAEEAAIAAFLAATEAELVAQKDAEDSRRAAEEQRAKDIEDARKAAHRGRITAIYQCATKAQGLPSARIANGIAAVEALVTDEATYQEFAREAADAKTETLVAMRDLFATTKAAEDAAAAQEAQRVEQARVAEEQRAEAARLDQAREMIAKAERESKERIAKEEAELDRKRQELAVAQKAAAEAPRRAAEERMAPCYDAANKRVGFDLPYEVYLRFAGDHGEKVPLEMVDEYIAALNALQAAETTEARDSQNVLKAEALAPDATDRDAPVNTSPSVGSMGAGQPADAGAAVVGTLNVGAICKRFGNGLTMTAAFIEQELGVTPATTDKAAKLFTEAQFRVICDRLMALAGKVRSGEAVAA